MRDWRTAIKRLGSKEDGLVSTPALGAARTKIPQFFTVCLSCLFLISPQLGSGCAKRLLSLSKPHFICPVARTQISSENKRAAMLHLIYPTPRLLRRFTAVAALSVLVSGTMGTADVDRR